ncbi:ras-related and estrogen-regulated growth inhibitor-like [Actinia tenebrosa]|uniref:small monomeric GTPase n=1 Tax=Actinia tenebrosa TaxID=6105 RepID=A0A6P8J5I6_ACTTE|nr:ras-related and estrogen-regulated growth inhibitor-like [Actinia tenebrosa]
MRSRKVNQVHSDIKSIRIVLLGLEGVGKSAFLVRFLTRRFIGEYDQTLESSYKHIVELDGVAVCLDILDTAGEITNCKLQQCKIQGDVFVILYSIADKETFRQATKIGRYLNHFKSPGAPTAMVLVGNKNDLEHFRQVESSQGREFSSELECLFKEISISERTGYEEVNDVIHGALRQYLAIDQPDKKKKLDRRENSSVSYLSKMKEGLMKRTGSIRRKSVAF